METKSEHLGHNASSSKALKRKKQLEHVEQKSTTRKSLLASKKKLLLAEHFEGLTCSKTPDSLKAFKRHITLSFEHHQKPKDITPSAIIQNKIPEISPDVLTLHTIKIPKGYTPIKAVFNYTVYTQSETSALIKFKLGTQTYTIVPLKDGIKKHLKNEDSYSKPINCFKGDLELNLKDTPLESMHLNAAQEIPFSIYVRDSKHHTFRVLVGCKQIAEKDQQTASEPQKSAVQQAQDEKYFRLFQEKLQQCDIPVFEMN